MEELRTFDHTLYLRIGWRVVGLLLEISFVADGHGFGLGGLDWLLDTLVTN